MTTLDRYIVRLFLTNFVVLFAVVVVLVVLSDLLLFNLDEFVQAAQQEEETWLRRVMLTAWLVVDFWGPMVFLLFGYLVGLIPVGAAGFTLWTMIRNRELVALLAGGVSMYRIAMPILAVGFGLNLLMVANQELVLPGMAHKLARSQSDLSKGGYKSFDLPLTSDGSGSLYAGETFRPNDRVIEGLTILRRRAADGGFYGPATERITAELALWQENPDGTTGWSLVGGERVWVELGAEETGGPPTSQHREPIGFVASRLDPMQLLLRHQSRFAQLMSVRDLVALRRGGGAVNPALLERTIHTRFSGVAINMLVLMMTLPYFLRRAPGSLMWPVLKAAGLGVGAWGSGLLMVQIPPQAFLPPVAVAWMPVVIYVVVAYILIESIET